MQTNLNQFQSADTGYNSLQATIHVFQIYYVSSKPWPADGFGQVNLDSPHWE